MVTLFVSIGTGGTDQLVAVGGSVEGLAEDGNCRLLLGSLDLVFDVSDSPQQLRGRQRGRHLYDSLHDHARGVQLYRLVPVDRVCLARAQQFLGRRFCQLSLGVHLRRRF